MRLVPLGRTLALTDSAQSRLTDTARAVPCNSFYENAMACEGNAISGKESQKHLDSMRFEHPPAILASREALPGFVDSGIKVCSLPARITSTINAQRMPRRTKVQLLPLQS